MLIYPHFMDDRTQETDISALPIGLYSVAATLTAAGLEVEILNAWQLGKDIEKMTALLKERKPQIIGFSILQGNRWGAIDMARLAKSIDPGVTVVMGGVGAATLWHHLLSNFPQIDYCVTGEGELTFLRLAERLQPGTPPFIGDIPGLAFNKNGEVIHTGPAEPIPDLDTLADPARYYTFQHMALTRGCPENCTFCGSPSLWGRRARSHSAGYFVGQLECLAQKGVRFFYVSDDTFTLDRNRVMAVCEGIIEKRLPISWAAISRVDRVDEMVLSSMRRAGCIQISYGVESGSEKIRKRFNKRLNEEAVKRAFSLTLSFGILPRAYFIYGSPGESDETIQETKALMDAIKPLGAIFYILKLFPGTVLYGEYLAQTGQTNDIWLERREDIAYFETDPALSKDQVLSWGKALRNHFYTRLPQYVKAAELVEDPMFRPLHADFYSRLGMTFHKGEYAAIDAIPDKERVAVFCYEKALRYHDHPRAYLGLGMLRQQARDFDAALKILEKGLRLFPGDLQLNLCMGIGFMNLGQFKAALPYLKRAETLPGTAHFIAQCERFT